MSVLSKRNKRSGRFAGAFSMNLYNIPDPDPKSNYYNTSVESDPRLELDMLFIYYIQQRNLLLQRQ